MSEKIHISESGPDSKPEAVLIAEAYPYNDFRRYSSISGKLAVKFLQGMLSEMISREGVRTWVVRHRERLSGMAILSPSPWETGFFGLKMGRLDLFVVDSSVKEVYSTADKLLEAALKAAHDTGLEHLSLRVDSEDIGVVHALEEHGFRLMDTLFTYAYHPKKCILPEIRETCDLRTYTPGDLDAVLDITATAFKDYPNRFSVDPNIPEARTQAFYLEWARKCCQGDLADEMIVAERKKRVIGYLGWRVNRDLERHTGVRIEGGGLGACYPLRFNVYLELLRTATLRTKTRAHGCDYETHSFNMATTNFYQKLDFRFARAKYSFHCWLVGRGA